MAIAKSCIVAAGAALVVTGCASPSITNLTPTQYPRAESGCYHFEAALNSREKAMKEETIDAFVIVDRETYSMEPTALVDDRWETLVPIDEQTGSVRYRFKFDYLYDSIPTPRQNSISSRGYKLRVVDPSTAPLE